MEKQVIRTPRVPETGGPFNLAVRHGHTVYISGLPPFEEDYCKALRDARAEGRPLPAFPDIPFEDQTRIVMNHIKHLMEAAGSSMDHLLKVTVWLKDQNDHATFDAIYREYFSSADALPARTRMQAGRTPLDCGLEVDAIGYIPDEEDVGE
jgi:2-iminobutanoate/2-iminopropanoate deaminase